MHIHARIEVGIGLILTHRAPEQLAPLRSDALAAPVREPLALGATARAVLRCPVGIDLDGHGTCGVGLVFAVAIDLAAQLISLPAVHAGRLAPALRFELAQAFEQQHAAGIASTHVGNAARHHLCGVLVHAPRLIATAFSRCA